MTILNLKFASRSPKNVANFRFGSLGCGDHLTFGCVGATMAPEQEKVAARSGTTGKAFDEFRGHCGPTPQGPRENPPFLRPSSLTMRQHGSLLTP